MNKPQVSIKTKGCFSEISINGQKLDRVRGYKFSHEAGSLPQLIIDLDGTNLTVETTMLPDLPYPYSSFYISKQLLIDKGLVGEKDLEVF